MRRMKERRGRSEGSAKEVWPAFHFPFVWITLCDPLSHIPSFFTDVMMWCDQYSLILFVLFLSLFEQSECPVKMTIFRTSLCLRMDSRLCDYRVGLNPSCSAHSYYQGFYYTSIAMNILAFCVFLGCMAIRVWRQFLSSFRCLAPPFSLNSEQLHLTRQRTPSGMILITLTCASKTNPLLIFPNSSQQFCQL